MEDGLPTHGIPYVIGTVNAGFGTGRIHGLQVEAVSARLEQVPYPLGHERLRRRADEAALYCGVLQR